MHKCRVGRVVTCSWWWLHSLPASSFYERYARLRIDTSGGGVNRVFSRPVAWLVVTMETGGQTNQPCVTTGSPPYLTIRSC